MAAVVNDDESTGAGRDSSGRAAASELQYLKVTQTPCVRACLLAVSRSRTARWAVCTPQPIAELHSLIARYMSYSLGAWWRSLGVPTTTSAMMYLAINRCVDVYGTLTQLSED